MLQHLLSAADWGSSFAPQFKLRALRALKHIFRGLTTKRFVAEPVPVQGSSVMGAWVLGGEQGSLHARLTVCPGLLKHSSKVSFIIPCSWQHICTALHPLTDLGVNDTLALPICCTCLSTVGALSAGMQSITERLNAERQLYTQQLKAAAQPLQQLVGAHLPTFLNPAMAASGSSPWQVRQLGAVVCVHSQ